ncbi:Hca operon transcriptional activator HcaR [Streptomyces sp. RB5]|uniref:Hca operon transcriptional activator HcaR n=1 Tax=Streptomyces smaragdinus TaxID=2585196 RepID=A0A7K0CA04_9ACTN|nr:LysR family transcriptional regulator [Streptomyces smaragdinus]MQY10291.1 Hca operon transcriptional activator HcaR [Streptomyces smaragdinus]
MDFDLAQVRAFVAVVEQRHFGRAAAGLHLTQQALSRRVQRLEQLLGAQLFVRDSAGVQLTAAGERFLPHARQLLAVADAATSVLAPAGKPLRVDVWGIQRFVPYRFVEQLAALRPPLPVEPSMRRSTWAAMEALLRGEVDVAFGRVHDLDRPWPQELRHRIAWLEPIALLVTRDHRLASAAEVRPGELTECELVSLAPSTAPEMVGWYEAFAADFGITLDRSDALLGFPQSYVARAEREPDLVALHPAGLPDLPEPLRMVPLAGPVPHLPWSAIWRRDDRDPVLARFLHELSEACGEVRLDPEKDWVPAADREAL